MSTPPQATLVATGYMPLDIVLPFNEGGPPTFFAGGTCGNVSSILKYLGGWDTIPIGCLEKDAVGLAVAQDLQHWKVDTRFLHMHPRKPATIVCQRNERVEDSNIPVHRFAPRCPVCETRSPSFCAISEEAAEELMKDLPSPDIFFFDRVSKSIIKLARWALSKGALLFFEPFRVKSELQDEFYEALQLTHILKHSIEQREQLAPFLKGKRNTLLEIETLGEDGLQYRYQPSAGDAQNGRHLPALPVPHIADAVGSGDWCSATLIHRLGKETLQTLQTISQEALETAIASGQAAAAWNCQFIGARGSMSYASYQTCVERLQKPQVSLTELMQRLCKTCRDNKSNTEAL